MGDLLLSLTPIIPHLHDQLFERVVSSPAHPASPPWHTHSASSSPTLCWLIPICFLPHGSSKMLLTRLVVSSLLSDHMVFKNTHPAPWTLRCSCSWPLVHFLGTVFHTWAVELPTVSLHLLPSLLALLLYPISNTGLISQGLTLSSFPFSFHTLLLHDLISSGHFLLLHTHGQLQTSSSTPLLSHKQGN